VPVPRAGSLAELNGQLVAGDLADQQRRIVVRTETVGAAGLRELLALRPLPGGVFDASKQLVCHVDARDRVCVRQPYCSVPAHLAGRSAPTLAALSAGTWIDNREPVVLLGDSGTGKTHLLIGLGVAAAEAGRRVRHVTTAALVNELVEAADDKQLSRVVGRYARLDLLCPDELNYVHLDPLGAELLFQIITQREEKASIACASNAPFSEWSKTFTDPRLAAAIVDRLTFNAHIIQTGSDSYRLRSSRAANKGTTPRRPSRPTRSSRTVTARPAQPRI